MVTKRLATRSMLLMTRRPWGGSADKVVGRLVAGLRSGMSYSDARTIEELWAKAEFVRVTANGVRESQPHATQAW